jgi:hypothetical protein
MLKIHRQGPKNQQRFPAVPPNRLRNFKKAERKRDTTALLILGPL